jgi:hypothetical protein
MNGFRQRKFVVIGVAAAALVASGIAYATIAESTGVYTACKLNATGTIRLINPSLGSSSLLGHCTSLETQISWNQQGQPGAAGAAGPSGKDGTTGKDGSSVTSAALASGDTNCPAGGSQFTSISGASYACNGAKGDTGATGPAGSGGETFST